MGGLRGAGQTSRRVVPEKVATQEDVRRAFEELNDKELLHLSIFADFKARICPNSEGEDLLNQAFCDVLSGNRRWNKEKVEFKHFLFGVLRSITHNAIRKDHGRSNVVPLDQTDCPASTNPEALLMATEREERARQTLARIEQLFVDDTEVALIIWCLKLGMKGPEIQSDLGISKTEYETIVKRMRRKLVRMRGQALASLGGGAYV